MPCPGRIINILTMFCMAHYSSCSVGRKYIAFTTAQRHFTDETRNCRQCVMDQKGGGKERQKSWLHSSSALFSRSVALGAALHPSACVQDKRAISANLPQCRWENPGEDAPKLWRARSTLLCETDAGRQRIITSQGTGCEIMQTWVQTPTLPFPRCVTLNKWLFHPEPQVPLENLGSSPSDLWVLKQIGNVKRGTCGWA